MKKIVIDRSKWRCGGGGSTSPKKGHGDGYTALLNEEGYMCCLGFTIQQLESCDNKEILGMGEPWEYYNEHDDKCDYDDGRYRTYLIKPIEDEAMLINDDEAKTPPEKENELKGLFSKVGLDLQFVGQYDRNYDEKAN